MSSGRFVLHTWELARLPTPRALPADYEVRSGRAGELSDMLGIIAAALSSDPERTWDVGAVVGRLDRRIRATLGSSDCDYLLATTRGEPVAVSGVSRDAVDGEHFLTGVCVHPRHQRRGVGTGLLSRSLLRLQQMGLEAARVYAEEGSIADRHLYPHFDSVREGPVRCPSVEVELPRLMRGWLRFG